MSLFEAEWGKFLFSGICRLTFIAKRESATTTMSVISWSRGSNIVHFYTLITLILHIFKDQVIVNFIMVLRV